MKKTASLVLAATLALGAFSGMASADELTAQEKFEALVKKGIFTGIGSDGVAGLDQNMNRAQLAKIAALLYGLETDARPATSTFADVPSGSWYSGAVEAAAKAGLLLGTGSGKFEPNGEVTIEQLATVMTRVLGIQPDSSATVEGASSWAQKYVQAALHAGLIAPVDFQVPARRELLVVGAYDTSELQAVIQTAKDENKPSIGKLLALGVMTADDGQFGGAKTMTKADILKALGAMTNDKLDVASLSLPDSPTFADVLRAYLRALGYPADALKDSSQLVDKAIAAGIVSADSPLLKVQQLNVPVNREWGSYLTAGTLFNAATVTVDAAGNVKPDANKHLSQTMKLPSAPIKVELKDIAGVPTFTTLNSVDPAINTRLTSSVGGPVNVDTTAPSITAATIKTNNISKDVAVTGGANGTVQFESYEYLKSGTLTVSEASTLTITEIGNLNLSSISSVSLTQSLTAGSANELDLISKLGALDPQHDGISMMLLSQWGGVDGLVIKGTLKDAAGNTRAVTLTIQAYAD